MRKFLALMLALVLALSLMLAGCNNAGGNGDSGNDTPDAGTPDDTPTDAGDDDPFADSTPWTAETMPDFGVNLPPFIRIAPVREKSEEPLKLAFLYFKNNTFWNLVEEGAEAAKEYLANFNVEIDLIIIGNEITQVAFQGAVDACVVQGYDGIVCAPILDGTETTINSAVEAGIPVVTYCSEPIAPVVPLQRLAFFGSDATYNSNLYIEYVMEDTGGEPCKIGLITTYLGTGGFDQGNALFVEGLEAAAEGWEFVGPYEAKDSADLCYSWAKDMLTAHPDMKYIKVVGGGASGACKAVQEAGLTGECKVLANDEVPEHLMYLRSGEMGMILANNPSSYVFESFMVLYNYMVAGETPDYTLFPRAIENGAEETGRIPSTSIFVTLDIVDKYYPE